MRAARRRAPRDPDIRHNLRLVAAEVGDLSGLGIQAHVALVSPVPAFLARTQEHQDRRALRSPADNTLDPQRGHADFRPLHRLRIHDPGARPAHVIHQAARRGHDHVDGPAAALDLDRSGEIFLFHDSPIHR